MGGGPGVAWGHYKLLVKKPRPHHTTPSSSDSEGEAEARNLEGQPPTPPPEVLATMDVEEGVGLPHVLHPMPKIFEDNSVFSSLLGKNHVTRLGSVHSDRDKRPVTAMDFGSLRGHSERLSGQVCSGLLSRPRA